MKITRAQMHSVEPPPCASHGYHDDRGSNQFILYWFGFNAKCHWRHLPTNKERKKPEKHRRRFDVTLEIGQA